MSLYLWIKLIHIISSTVLFGTGLGTASVMFYGHQTRNPLIIAAINRYVVIADWIFTGSSGVIQPLTGFWLVYLAGYSFKSFWILGSIMGYLIALACWIPVVFLQIKLRDLAMEASRNKKLLPREYFNYFNYWFWLGWPAFISLIGVFYLMTNKPL